MRWEALFADLEAQLAAAGHSARESEIADRQRGESAAIELADRLRGQIGRTLKVHVDAPCGALRGVLAQLGSGWLLVRADAGTHVVPVDAIRMVEGMDRFTVPETGAVRLGLQAALRGLARDRYPVHLQLRGGLSAAVHGSIDRVGRDFLELAVLEAGLARRRGNVASAAVVPLREIAVVSSLR
ncbi:hypothetical protein H9639_08730 [Arthrobacter sp. Sa2CUA1]|uniref:Fis family transcriptional regulator n=1 Tax=Arthrobacter gallicola TaxID=2762225 RepID=A0ABR8US62_9MICC|nr:hypothetical protein [Arthrobacter gallicola]MBD7995378.1 hypothetical protein [Arthrobacter gallicola]